MCKIISWKKNLGSKNHKSSKCPWFLFIGRKYLEVAGIIVLSHCNNLSRNRFSKSRFSKKSCNVIKLKSPCKKKVLASQKITKVQSVPLNFCDYWSQRLGTCSGTGSCITIATISRETRFSISPSQKKVAMCKIQKSLQEKKLRVKKSQKFKVSLWTFVIIGRKDLELAEIVVVSDCNNLSETDFQYSFSKKSYVIK